MLIYFTQKLATLANGMQENRGPFDDGKKSFKDVTRMGGESRFEIILSKALLFIFATSIIEA